MGCLKLRYSQGEALKENLIFLREGLVKKEAPLKKRDNYYPFGLQTADSWVADQTEVNNYLYNAGSELNESTNNYQTFFRDYDPALGRMTGVDIMANKYSSVSPYNYAFNDPIGLNDPSGADPYGGGANPGGWSFENGDWYDNRPPQAWNNNVTNEYMIFGSYAPGNAGDWGNGVRGWQNNYMVMSQNGFSNFYNVDVTSQQGKANFARSVGTSTGGGLGGFINGMAAVGSPMYGWNPYGGRSDVSEKEWLAAGGNKEEYEASLAAGENPSLTLGAWESMGDLIDLSEANSGRLLAQYLRSYALSKRADSRVNRPFLHDFINMLTKFGNLGDKTGFGGITKIISGRREIFGEFFDITIIPRMKIGSSAYDPTNWNNQLGSFGFREFKVGNNITSKAYYNSNGSNKGLIVFSITNQRVLARQLYNYIIGQ